MIKARCYNHVTRCRKSIMRSQCLYTYVERPREKCRPHSIELAIICANVRGGPEVIRVQNRKTR